VANIELDRRKIAKFLNSQLVLKLKKRKAEEIMRYAKEIYLAERVRPNHNLYLQSFEVRRAGNNYITYNSDPVAFWVEFGSRVEWPPGSGQKYDVLGYAPLRRAIDAASIS